MSVHVFATLHFSVLFVALIDASDPLTFNIVPIEEFPHDIYD